jgi:hypothetical protein
VSSKGPERLFFMRFGTLGACIILKLLRQICMAKFKDLKVPKRTLITVSLEGKQGILPNKLCTILQFVPKR